MRVEYVQWKYIGPTFAKDLTEHSKEGGILNGWELVCIHPVREEGNIFYVCTLWREVANPGQGEPK